MATRPGSTLQTREMAQGVYIETIRSTWQNHSWVRVTLYLSAFNTQRDEFRTMEQAEKHANEIASHYRINVIR